MKVLAVALAVAMAGCSSSDSTGKAPPPAPRDRDSAATAVSPDWAKSARMRMVDEQIAKRGIVDEGVLAAMRKVPRHEFIPEGSQDHAYEDHPVPIGESQTISQPYIVALMTELAGLDKDSRVLEVGTGSGYTGAVLAEVAKEVYSIEIRRQLGERARETLTRLGYGAVNIRIGDGYKGWPEAAPFDAIIVSAAPPTVPEALKQQLKVGGRLVIPVGEKYQELMVLTRTETGFDERAVLPVLFVKMVGDAGTR